MRKPLGIPGQRIHPVTLFVQDLSDRSITNVEWTHLKTSVIKLGLMRVNFEQVGKTE